MAGFREYRPGEVWFYYNANAKKELEERKTLGMLTCRPVVIIQDAFYPEWNDTITVVPMTSSDRRSGVYIDSTILNDGSMIEGGTVIPYLFYNVRCKFLFPCVSSGNKHKLISLAPEDFEKVKQGYLYHLGASSEVPDYVKEWKHLSDYNRNIVIRDIRLAISECDSMFLSNPIIKQTPPDSSEVENHVVGSMSILSPDRRSILASAPGESIMDFKETKLEDHGTYMLAPPLIDWGIKDILEMKKRMEHIPILFKAMSFDEVLDVLDHEGVEWMSAEKQYPRIFPGSGVLAAVEPKQAIEVLDASEAIYVLNMKLTDIMEKTGVKSMSTASRVRKELRLAYPEQVITTSGNVPDPLLYSASIQKPNRSRCKRSLKRRRILFRYTKNQLLEMVTKDISELEPLLPELSGSAIRQLIIDIGYMYPDAVVELSEGDSKPISEIRDELVAETELCERTSYALWETLSAHEVAEIASCVRKAMHSMAQKYGLSKDNFRILREKCVELTKKSPNIRQPPIELSREKEACCKVIDEDWKTLEIIDLVIFCRTDYTKIAVYYGEKQSGNTPSKVQVAKLKMNIRRHFINVTK